MTLSLALKGEDGLVLATDSRGTIGDPRALTAVNDSIKKLYRVNLYTGAVTFGAGELGAKLLDEILINVIQEKNLEEAGVDEVLEETRKYIKTKYNEWFAAFSIEKRPRLGFIIAGYNPTSSQRVGESRTYMIDSPTDWAPHLAVTGMQMGGVPQYATYLFHRLYNPKMKTEHLKSLAAYLITETASQDPKVGGPIQMAVILPTGYIEVPQDEIRKIVEKNEEKNSKLRSFFFD
jgi:20S proteasome alpha/beta subunit